MKGSSSMKEAMPVSMHEDGARMLTFRAADGTTFQVSSSVQAEDCSSVAADVVESCDGQNAADCPNKDRKIMQVQSHPDATPNSVPADLKFWDRYYLQKCTW